MSKGERIAALFVAIALGAIGFIPLFGNPGYEHAVASGLIVPSTAAIATALYVSRDCIAPLAAIAIGVRCGTVLALIAYAAAMVHGLRVGFCSIPEGTIHFVLTAGAGSIVGGVWGALSGLFVQTTRWRKTAAVFAALSGPLGGIAISLVRFYTSPMIFAFDPFVGYFSGTLYDTVIDATEQLVSYRACSFAFLASVGFLSSIAERKGNRWLFNLHSSAQRLRALAGLIFGIAGLVFIGYGSDLGWWHSSATIRSHLGGAKSGSRCEVIFPESMRPEESDLLLRDCEEELASVERAFATRGPDRIVAFFFKDAAEKRRYMGAADTYIAKPWRKEVYLQQAAYPHPVLGHELAHVVAGTFGQGPFHIAGRWGGLLPNPGLIEGVAVAASTDDDPLTDAEWVRAMLDLNILPPISRVFSLDFLGQNSAKSYTVAGAFVKWLLHERGPEVVRRWYAGESIEAVTGQSLDSLDDQFRIALQAYALNPETITYAKAKFDRPSVFGRKCPHTIDALKKKGDIHRDAGRIEKARGCYDDVLARDEHDFGAHYQRGLLSLRRGTRAQGLRELEELSGDEKVPKNWRDKSAEALADDALVHGDTHAASKQYQALAKQTPDEDAARTLEVKAWAAEHDDARIPIATLLIGTADRPADSWLGGVFLSAWAARTDDPIAHYLLGRNETQHLWFEEAAAHLDKTLAARDTIPLRVWREALRQRATIACARKDRARITEIQSILAKEDPFANGLAGRAEWLNQFLERCAR